MRKYSEIVKELNEVQAIANNCKSQEEWDAIEPRLKALYDERVVALNDGRAEQENQEEIAKREEERVAKVVKEQNDLIMKALKCKNAEKANEIIAKTGLDIVALNAKMSAQGYVTLSNKRGSRDVVISKCNGNDKTKMFFYGSDAKSVPFKNMGKVNLVGFLTAADSERDFLNSRIWSEKENKKVSEFKEATRLRIQESRNKAAQEYMTENLLELVIELSEGKVDSWDFKYKTKEIHDNAWNIEHGYEVK